MRALRMPLTLVFVLTVAACGENPEAPEPVGFEPQFTHTTGEVTGQDLVDAGEKADPIVNEGSFRSLFNEIEARADAHDVDLQNLSEYEEENLQSVLGYSDAEWNDVLAEIEADVNAVTSQVPELTWDSYETEADSIVDGGKHDDDGPKMESVGPASVRTGARLDAPDDRRRVRPVRFHASTQRLRDMSPRELNAYLAYLAGNPGCSDGALAGFRTPGGLDSVSHPMWPSWGCVFAAAKFTLATAGTALSVSSCAGGNVLGCRGMYIGFAAMGYTGWEFANECFLE